MSCGVILLAQWKPSGDKNGFVTEKLPLTVTNYSWMAWTGYELKCCCLKTELQYLVPSGEEKRLSNCYPTLPATADPQ